jgi:adenosylcobinamide kinase (EC 2.7.1.156)
MRLRIEKHKAERKELFDTFEEPVNVTEVLKNIDNNYDVILFECLTTYLGNLYYYQLDVQERIDGLVDVLSNMSSDVIVVSNEVGWGIIPENPIARQYAEMLGKTNTRLAKLAKEVYLVVSGIGVRIK